jgi:hypothetical protein
VEVNAGAHDGLATVLVELVAAWAAHSVELDEGTTTLVSIGTTCATTSGVAVLGGGGGDGRQRVSRIPSYVVLIFFFFFANHGAFID